MAAENNEKRILLAGVLALLTAAFFVLFWRKVSNPLGVKYPEVNTPVLPPIDTGALNQQADEQVQIDIQTGQVRFQVGSALAGGFAGTASGIAAGSVSGSFITLSATAWTGIGALVAGGLVLFAALRSNAHLFANQVVDLYENPFAQKLSSVVDAKDAGVTNGTFRQRELKQAYNAIEVLWKQYEDAMLTLKQKGGDWAKVAQQSLDNLNSAHGMGGLFPDGFIDTVLAKVQMQIDEATA